MISNNNPLLKGLSGRLGDLVFRQVGGRTVISKMPRKPDKSKETAAQRATRDRLKLASAYAMDRTQDEEGKNYYLALAEKLNLSNAYTAALTEYMRNKDR